MNAMFRSLVYRLTCAFALATASLLASAQSVSISFENLADGTQVDNAYQSLGVTFSNAMVATAGLSLNELQFPPSSGTNVVFDEGFMTLTFSQAITSFSANFTYLTSLNLSGLASDGSSVVGASSLYSSNDLVETSPGSGVFTDATPGASPNELIQLNSSTGFTQVVIAGSPDGGSFTLDDLAFTIASATSGPPTAAPEINAASGQLALGLLAALACLFAERARHRQRSS